jgi:hypothetical protein
MILKAMMIIQNMSHGVGMVPSLLIIYLQSERN